ncbi:MAG: GNAT family N-acetyltransferase [Williamsia herbipolensis]|nr:GNAT family N-acetyltransferase [Williamsia herbipolensis]
MIARTRRLSVSPLRPTDVEELVDMVTLPELHRMTGGAPADRDEARGRVERWLAGSPKPGITWINHVARLEETGDLVGHCQGTIVPRRGTIATDCTLGYTVHPDHQGHGIAHEMMRAFVGLVVETDQPHQFLAHIAPGHTASEHVVAALGLTATDHLDRAGERIWASAERV